MELSFLKINKQKSEHSRQYKDVKNWYYLEVLVAVTLLGLFFTSTSWFKSTDDIQATAIGDSVDFSNDVSLTLKRWEYNPDTELTEIEIAKNSILVDDDYSMTMNLYADGETVLGLKIAYDSDAFMVLQSTDRARKADYLQLNMIYQHENANGESTTETHVFTADMQTIEQNPSLSMDKTDAQYEKLSIQNDIQLQEDKIKQYTDRINELSQNITNYKSDLEDLQANMDNLTSEERSAAGTKINRYNQAIKQAEDEITAKQIDIEALEKDIQTLQKKLESYE